MSMSIEAVSCMHRVCVVMTHSSISANTSVCFLVCFIVCMYHSEMPSALLSDTLLKLTNAESLYRQQNP